MFHNRQSAGNLLGEKLAALLPTERDQIIVVGLPRGGVPVAKEVATKLQAPLTILVAKKIGAPGQPEYAIGAVTSTGTTVLNPDINYPTLNARTRAYIDAERTRLMSATQMQERYWLSVAGLERPIFKNKVVVIVDDGIATGMTAIAAARSARNLGARKVIVAAPVAALGTVEELQKDCDEVVAVVAPREFTAVGAFYYDFSQTEEDEMLDILRSYNNDRKNSTKRAG